jgi:uncharacterized damage-inducible protein DinB
MSYASLIDEYRSGPQQLREALAGMTQYQLDATPVPGRWSTRQVVCHIADFEPIYADRIKRVIAEDRPTLFGADPDRFAARLAYAQRDVEEELHLIQSVRDHLARILQTLKAEDFQRTGVHSEAGPLTLESFLRNVTRHLPHHVRFIQEKRHTLGL